MAAPENEKTTSFEEQLAGLEAIVKELDSDELPLEQAIAAYERGVKLSAALNKTLEEAQRKIEVLTRNADGEVVAEPFETSDA
jgi:exodeoxyribonuclease VII small subunit